MSDPPIPGSNEDLLATVNELTRQWEVVVLTMRTMTEELQALRKSNDLMNDHCTLLIESLWAERGRTQDLERQVEWFRELAGTRAERLARDTPVEGLPSDEEAQ